MLNDQAVQSDLPPATVVLDYLRRERGLTGTKEVCREGDCGACLVLLGERERVRRGRSAGRAASGGGAGTVMYRPAASCLLPLGQAAGRHVVSIEGLNQPLPRHEGRGDAEQALPLNPVQRHLVREGAVQCGYCTPGFVIAITGFLLNAEELSLPAAVQAVAGNICRCTGYASIRRALAAIYGIDAHPPASSADLRRCRRSGARRRRIGLFLLPALCCRQRTYRRLP